MQNQPQNQESREIRDLPLKQPFISTALLYLQAKMKELGIRYFGTEEQKKELRKNRDRKIWSEFTNRLEALFEVLQQDELAADTNTVVQNIINLLMKMDLIKIWPAQGIQLNIGEISFNIYGLMGLGLGYAGADLPSQPNITIGYLDQRRKRLSISVRSTPMSSFLETLKQIDPHPLTKEEIDQKWKVIIGQLQQHCNETRGQCNPSQYLNDIRAVEQALQDQGFRPEQKPNSDVYRIGGITISIENTRILIGGQNFGSPKTPFIKVTHQLATGKEVSFNLSGLAGSSMNQFMNLLSQVVAPDDESDDT